MLYITLGDEPIGPSRPTNQSTDRVKVVRARSTEPRAPPREPITSACPESIDPARAEASPRAPTHTSQPFSVFAQSF
jgi:hypothetical protein